MGNIVYKVIYADFGYEPESELIPNEIDSDICDCCEGKDSNYESLPELLRGDSENERNEELDVEEEIDDEEECALSDERSDERGEEVEDEDEEEDFDPLEYKRSRDEVCILLGVDPESKVLSDKTTFVTQMVGDGYDCYRASKLLPPPFTEITEPPKVPVNAMVCEFAYVLKYSMYALHHNGSRVEFEIRSPLYANYILHMRIAEFLEDYNRSFATYNGATNKLVFYVEDFKYRMVWRHTNENGTFERYVDMNNLEFGYLCHSIIRAPIYTCGKRLHMDSVLL